MVQSKIMLWQQESSTFTAHPKMVWSEIVLWQQQSRTFTAHSQLVWEIVPEIHIWSGTFTAHPTMVREIASEIDVWSGARSCYGGGSPGHSQYIHEWSGKCSRDLCMLWDKILQIHIWSRSNHTWSRTIWSVPDIILAHFWLILGHHRFSQRSSRISKFCNSLILFITDLIN